MWPIVRGIQAVFLAGAVTLGLVAGSPALVAADPPAAFSATGCEHLSDSVYRLYQAAFGRVPDQSGFDYWLDQYQSGVFPLSSQAGYFIASPEFVGLYGADPSDEDFVDTLYLNVLGRPGESDGRTYWLAQLATGLSRTQLLLAFTDSDENVARTETVAPMLGSFNQGLQGPWDCEQPSCWTGVDESIGAPQVSYSAVSIMNTKAITLSIELRTPGEEPIIRDYDLGPARAGERMGWSSSPAPANSCAVAAVTYDPSPYVAPAAVCSILPPTGQTTYDVGVDYVVRETGEASLAVAVRDSDGHRMATGYHVSFGAPVGTKVTTRTGSYPVSTRVAESCEVLSITYSE